MAWQWKSRVSSPSVLLATIVLGGPAQALNDNDVREMERACESARQEALAPIRERRTQSCIEQQLRSKEHCERYYRTYGNTTPGPSGAPQQGFFYDLPECQQWLQAREALRESRSQP